MKVILKSEVDNVGLAGDVVDVADGYGRNFLIPRGLAIPATRGAMKEAEALLRSRKATEARTVGDAEAARQALEARTLRIGARVDERGSLYGSVSANDIQRVLKERGHDIPRKRIEMRGTFKEIGTYEVPVRVHPQVVATVVVEVVDEEGVVTVGGGPTDEPGEEHDALVEQALEAAEEYEQAQAEAERLEEAEQDEADPTAASADDGESPDASAKLP